jgi:hypothetical protein
MSLVLILKMESTPNSVKDLTLVELKNGRRVCKSIKRVCIGGEQGFLLASDMMFASSCMDVNLHARLLKPLALTSQKIILLNLIAALAIQQVSRSPIKTTFLQALRMGLCIFTISQKTSANLTVDQSPKKEKRPISLQTSMINSENQTTSM